MNFVALDWFVLASVPAIAWLISRRGRSVASWRGYFLGSGSLSTTSVAGTYFGANLTFTAIFLILSAEAFERGPWVFVIPLFWLLGTVVFVLNYRHVKPFVLKGLTLHQMLRDAFAAPVLQRWASVWTIVAFVLTVALEFYGGIKLLEWAQLPQFANLSLALMLAFSASALTVMGGFRGVAWADMWLDIVSLAGTAVLLYYGVRSSTTGISWSAVVASGDAHASFSLVDNLLFVIAMAVLFIPFQFCTLDSWQRLGAWQERAGSPAKLLLGSAFLLCAVYCVPILIGLAVRHAGLPVPLDSHPLKVFLDHNPIRSGILGLLFAGFVAAMFSTADELLNCCGMSLLFDTMQIDLPASDLKPGSAQQTRIVASGKFYTSLFAFAAALIALLAIKLERQVTDLAIVVFSSQVVFTVPLAIALFAPKRAPMLARSACCAMLVGFLTTIGFVIWSWLVHDRQLSDAAPIAALVGASLTACLGWLVAHRKLGQREKQ